MNLHLWPGSLQYHKAGWEILRSFPRGLTPQMLGPQEAAMPQTANCGGQREIHVSLPALPAALPTAVS